MFLHPLMFSCLESMSRWYPVAPCCIIVVAPRLSSPWWYEWRRWEGGFADSSRRWIGQVRKSVASGALGSWWGQLLVTSRKFPATSVLFLRVRRLAGLSAGAAGECIGYGRGLCEVVGTSLAKNKFKSILIDGRVFTNLEKLNLILTEVIKKKLESYRNWSTVKALSNNSLERLSNKVLHV